MEKTKPAFEIRIGEVQLTFWKADSNGVARYRVTSSRNFKEGEEWKSEDLTEILEKIFREQN
ncbi:MAG: hypothetical protein KC931_24200 [Candidatus Omnitrophica bacterium]|nr:hypothetical protein [Candidatus Omnitrophota bacterium]MCA9450246.1 hypothetical protein [Candidatus Omnitrophota bacterium]